MVYKHVLQKRAQKVTSVRALDNFAPEYIVVSPILTEKSYKFANTDDAKMQPKYSFRIHSRANKNDVKHAVKYLYSVDVEHVNILVVPQKGRSQRKLVRRSYKKAVVTLKEGQRLEFFK